MIGDSPATIEKVYGHPTDTDIIASLQLQPAAANTTTPQVAAQTAAAPAVQAVQPAAQQESKKIEATKNIGGV